MARRGRKRNLNREDEYWKLILAGIGLISVSAKILQAAGPCSRS